MSAPKGSTFFYGPVVTAAGFMIWFIGWGAFTASFSVFLKPLVAEFGWTRADASRPQAHCWQHGCERQ